LILTDREIRNSIESGLFDITPRPALDVYSSTTVDLTLSPILRVFQQDIKGLRQTIDPSEPGFDATELIKKLTDRVDIDPKETRQIEGTEFGSSTLDIFDVRAVVGQILPAITPPSPRRAPTADPGSAGSPTAPRPSRAGRSRPRSPGRTVPRPGSRRPRRRPSCRAD